MKFLDQAKIFLRSGDGAAGCVSFRREKFIEFGGPDGGNGGKGGDISIRAIPNLNTLIDYRYRQHFKAPKGQHGMGKSRHGKAGGSLVLDVPIGTQVWNQDRDLLLADLVEPNQQVCLLQGGRGGLGNEHFKSSTNRAPRYAQPGEPGIEQWVWLHLKLIADVGLIGLPNAGKSTLLAKVSQAKPKIADYPFTTLSPQLGVVQLDHTREFIMADLPGLIAGAHEAKGLGDRFLGHAERCAFLIHLIDASAEDVTRDYQTIRKEIEAYGLTPQSEILVLNKIDALTPEEVRKKKRDLQEFGKPTARISGLTGEGVHDLLEVIWAQLNP